MKPLPPSGETWTSRITSAPRSPPPPPGEIIAPVRDRAFRRQEELDYLQQRKLPVPPFGAAYSINRGLWGVTIGGTETLTSKGSIPESAWVLSKHAFDQPRVFGAGAVHLPVSGDNGAAHGQRSKKGRGS